MNSFVGRERELAELRQLLPYTRLLTLWGPAGCGKSRLAVELVGGALDQFPDGVCLVELETVSDPALVPHAVAAVLGVREEEGRPLTESLMVRIGTRKLLLVLDTCQHLMDATAGLAEALLSACSNLVIVATTRQFLGIPGETVVNVPPLSLPEPGGSLDVERVLQSDAVRLFVERAAAHNRGFALTDQTVGAVAEVCRRLDGLPLAIELAARMVALPIEQLATRLDERFRLLVGGSRTAHRRHRTLQASVDWSYELLETDERQLFERLSVFVDGFGLEAAEAICGADGLQPEAVLGLVRLLVEKSLVGADLGSIDARYRLLETLRLYAWERLLKSSLAEATQTRHAAYYLAFAARAVQSLHGPEREMWLHRLERDQGNLRAALRSFGDRGDAHACLQLVLALSPFWDASGWFEVTLPISRAGPPAARAEALEAAGTVAWYRGDLATAASLLDASLVLRRQLGDNDGAVSALNRLGVVARERGDTTGASALFEEALANSYQHGNDPGMANALHNLGLVASDRGDFERAAQLYGAADALTEHNPNVMPRADRTTRERNIPELRAQLGDEAFDLAWATGRDMSVEHVIPRAQTAAMVPGELASSYADLTPRELEVLQLIASGLSNREIAERLVLSARTVERHITNLYGKIAVRGKAGATAYALRHGLAAN